MLRAAVRIIRADFATRPLHAALTGLVIAIAAGTLLVTMYMRASLDEPYDQLRAATYAADAYGIGQLSDLSGLSRMPGVASSEPPRPLLDATIEFGRERDVMTLIDTPGAARLDRPRVITGRAARAPGEVLLDHVLADFKGVRAGSTLELGTGAHRLRLRVVGTGAWTHPGPVGWVLPGGVAAAQRAIGGRIQYAVAVRLRDPRSSVAFAEAAAQRFRARDLNVQEWQATRDEFTDDSRRMLDDHQRHNRARPDRRGLHARDRDRRARDRAAPPDRAAARGRDHPAAGDGADDRPLRGPGPDRRAPGAAGRRADCARPRRRHRAARSPCPRPGFRARAGGCSRWR